MMRIFRKAYQSVNLKQSQWWSKDRLVELQEERLREMVKYAYDKVTGYREKYKEHGIHPNRIKSLSDLKKLPIVTREDLSDLDRFTNREVGGVKRYTGGSTGKPLKYFESQEASKIRTESHLRGWSWMGYLPDKRLAVISSAQGVLNRSGTLNLIGDLSEKNISKNVKHIMKFKPKHVRGYVSSLYLFGLYLIERKIALSGIESVNTISENLYDYQREVIEKAFNAPVYEEYVCNDGGASAWECSAHKGLHYFMERSIIEEVNGQIITTDLWNKATPFIRYKNGDFVEFLGEDCICGRQLPLIKISGRANDILISEKGPVSPSYLIHHGAGLKFIGGDSESFVDKIGAVQYIQEPGFKLIVKLVKKKAFSKTDERKFIDQLKKILPGLEIKVDYVKKLDTTAKGKIRFILNKDKKLLKQYE